MKKISNWAILCLICGLTMTATLILLLFPAEALLNLAIKLFSTDGQLNPEEKATVTRIAATGVKIGMLGSLALLVFSVLMQRFENRLPDCRNSVWITESNHINNFKYIDYRTMGVVGLLVLLRLIIGTLHWGDSLGYDEIFSWKNYAQHGIIRSIGWEKNVYYYPNNHPLNSILMGMEGAISKSEYVLRVHSQVAGALLIAACFGLSRTIGLSFYQASAASAIVCFSPWLDIQAAQARGYTLSALFATLSVWAYILARANPGSRQLNVALSLCCALLMISQFSNLPIPLALYLHWSWSVFKYRPETPSASTSSSTTWKTPTSLQGLAIMGGTLAGFLVAAPMMIHLLRWESPRFTIELFTSMNSLQRIGCLFWLECWYSGVDRAHPLILSFLGILFIVCCIVNLCYRRQSVAALLAFCLALFCLMNLPSSPGRAFFNGFPLAIVMVIETMSAVTNKLVPLQKRPMLKLTGTFLLITIVVVEACLTITRPPYDDFRDIYHKAFELAQGRPVWSSGLGNDVIDFYGHLQVQETPPAGSSLYIDWIAAWPPRGIQHEIRRNGRVVFETSPMHKIFEYIQSSPSPNEDLPLSTK